MKRSTIALATALAAVLLALPLTLAASNHPAAWMMLGSSYGDAVINPPVGEDSDFFVSSTGIPNIMFVLDTSYSMVRLPPDGASLTWGSFQDGSASDTTTNKGYGCVNPFGNNLKFHSACGTLTNEEKPYATSADWAAETDGNGQHCPYMVQGNQAPKTDAAGFDPEFYTNQTKYFTPTQIFHDVLSITDPEVRNGWSDSSPASSGASRWATSQSSFCSSYGATTSAIYQSCNTCLTTQGYWFDGTYVTDDAVTAIGQACTTTNDCKAHSVGTCVDPSTMKEYTGAAGGGRCYAANVWFTGNFLNFYPPKFIVARKVLKDVLMEVRKIRLGLTAFNGDNGGSLIKAPNPPCNQIGKQSSFDSNRGSVKSQINNLGFSGSTPLAETLLNVGQLYRTKRTNGTYWFSNAYQLNAFRDGSENSETKSVCYPCQASAVLILTDGIPNKDSQIPGIDVSSSPMTKAIADTTGANKVYTGDSRYNITGISTTDCPVCETDAERADTSILAGTCNGQQASGACDDSQNPITAYLPRVAWYLQNVDSRLDDETYKGAPMTGKQVISTYTIGFGTRDNASLILKHTATAGGGLFNGGLGDGVFDAKSLKDAIMRSFEDVNTRSTGFGAVAISPLQAAASQGVLIPRFEPARAAHWIGHLYSYRLYSEFTSGDNPIPGFVPCYIPTNGQASGPANGDYDCDGKCNSVFLMDADTSQPAFIMENGTGQFVRNSPFNRAACGFGNACAAANCATASTALAVPLWDAGNLMAPIDFTTPSAPVAKAEATSPSPTGFQGWQARNVYTVVDSDGDGKITSADTLLLLDDSSTLADKLAPYLNIRGGSFCGELASRLVAAGNTTVGNTIKTETAAGTYTTCARTMIQYLRGADVFNELASYNDQNGSAVTCSTFPITYCTRPYQLGDIFHSSPIEVHPPLASDGLLCDTGFDPQCLASLYRTPTPGPSAASHANAYDDYAKSSRYQHRQKFTLVGANDGLLHAIQSGTYSSTTKSYDGGSGREIWAFAPPDLLAKLPLFMGIQHQFFVDATPMVRDVWIDGYANRLPSSDTDPVAADGAKQGAEFHTIAVMGERRGGTHYFALDVTDAGADLEGKPRFLWIYPQPGDPEQQSFANTWAEFTPTPPPIGPVRIDAGAAPCGSGTSTMGNRCYTEKWMVMLSGGFDVQYTKGRGVHMVDVSDGTELFDFSRPAGTGATCDPGTNPACALQYPVAATVGLMAWGVNANFLGTSPNDYFFDTATFGDTGGQVWVLRFNKPGIRSPAGSGKVTNWVGARAFQQDKANALSCGLNFCGGVPFFHVTANVPLAVNGLYHVLLGSGDRYNLLDVAGGRCGPDNLRACVLKGCSVKLEDAAGTGPGAVYGVEGSGSTGSQSYGMNLPAQCSAVNASTYSFTVAAPGAGSGVVSRVSKLKIDCPLSAVCPTNDSSNPATAESTAKSMAVSCKIDSGSNEFCAPAPLNDPGVPLDLVGDTQVKNWFYSILVFEKEGNRQIFDTPADALTYDAHRLTDTDLVLINDHDTDSTKPLASPESNGWRYFFDHGSPNATSTVTLTDGNTYDIYRSDERVASTTGVGASCSFWNTMQPTIPPAAVDTANQCPIASPCQAGKSQVSYLYGANPATGDLCLPAIGGGSNVRAIQLETLVPPHMGKLVAYLSKNQVSFGLTTVRIPQGGSNIPLGQAQDIAQLQEWLPVDRKTHDCRHADKRGLAPDNANCKP
jgi:type IV pilus assembly protein PilY1